LGYGSWTDTGRTNLGPQKRKVGGGVVVSVKNSNLTEGGGKQASGQGEKKSGRNCEGGKIFRISRKCGGVKKKTRTRSAPVLFVNFGFVFWGFVCLACKAFF